MKVLIRFSFSLLVQLSKVELELSSLKDISVSSSALSWSGGNAGEESLRREQISQLLIDGRVLLSSSQFSLDGAGLLGSTIVLLGILGLGSILLSLGSGVLDWVLSVVLQEPLSEWGGVNGDNAVLHQSLGSDQIVIGGVVDDIDDLGLVGNTFTWPREVSFVQSEGSVLSVSSSGSNFSDSDIILISGQSGVAGGL